MTNLYFRYKTYNWIIIRLIITTIALLFLSVVVVYLKAPKPIIDIINDPVLYVVAIGTILVIHIPNLYVIIQHLLKSNIRELEINLNEKQIKLTYNNGQKLSIGDQDIEHPIIHLNLYYKNLLDGKSRRPSFLTDLGFWELKLKNGRTVFVSSLLGDFLLNKPPFESRYVFSLFPIMKKAKVDKTLKFIPKKPLSLTTKIDKLKAKIEQKSDQELISILENKKSYQDEAVQIAELILKNRKSKVDANT